MGMRIGSTGRMCLGILTLGVAMALTACGHRGTAAGKPVVTLTWLTRSDMGPKVVEWEKQVAGQYQHLHPDVHISIISVPWSAYNAKLLSLTAAGTPPAVYATFAAGFGTFLAKGTLANLTPYLRSSDVPMKQWNASAMTSLTRGGKVYGLPMDNMPSVLFYNATLFAKAHLPLPPTSWADRSWTLSTLVQDAKAISRHTTHPTQAVWGLNLSPGQFGTDLSWLWGCDPFAPSGGPSAATAYRTGMVSATYFTSACYTAAMRFAKNLSVTDHVSPSPTDMTALTTLGNDPFMTGRVGVQSGIYIVQPMLAVHPTFRWAIAPFAYGPGGKDTTKLWTDAWVMSRHTAHPKAAFQFLLYLTTGSRAKSFALTTGFFPALSTLQDSTLRFESKLTGMTLTYKQLKSVVLGGLAPGQAFEAPGHTLADFVQLNTAWSNTLDPFFLGKQSTASAMRAVSKAFAPLTASAAASAAG